MGIRLEPLGMKHLEQARWLSESAGWPHRKHDWQMLMALGKGLALIDEDCLVATAMQWSFSSELATLGMVIVSSHYKRRGLGNSILKSLLAQISAKRIELYATSEGANLYRSLGFSDVQWIYQCQGLSIPLSPSARFSTLPNGCSLRAARAEDFEAIVALDQKATDNHRRDLLRSLLGKGRALVMERKDGFLIGVALSREFGHGYVIGPVAAETSGVAISLVEAWLKLLVGRFVRLDTPEPRLAAQVEELGLHNVACVMQMATKPTPSSYETIRRYALASQAFG